MTVYTEACNLLGVKSLTIRQARQRRRWTQEQLAAATGIKQGVISRLETGAIANPSMLTMTRLADALGVDVRTLRFGQQPESVSL